MKQLRLDFTENYRVYSLLEQVRLEKENEELRKSLKAHKGWGTKYRAAKFPPEKKNYCLLCRRRIHITEKYCKECED